MYMILLNLLLMSFVIGCGSGDFDGNTTSGFGSSEKQYVKQLFEGPYLWYDHANTSIDPTPYTTPQALIEAYKYAKLDHWSFALTPEEYREFLNQKGGGFGIGFTSDLRVKFVRIDAPAWGKILRGDTLVKVNGEPATPERLHTASIALGISATFVLKRGENTVTVSVTPKAYTYHVSLDRIYHLNGRTIGYLRYDSFSDSSDKELAERFKDFDAAGIDELVVDLRYNGGGVVDRAIDLMGYISDAQPGEPAVHLAWNDRYRAYDTTYTFPSPPAPHAQGLTRVFFLVTRNSASASELAIHGLVPYLGDTNVITIGTATHGKNVGMAGVEHGGYYYFLINFYVKNAAESISSAAGIPPTCSAEDDLGHALGDTNETLLKSALYYIEHGACLPSPSPKRVGHTPRHIPSPLFVDGQRPFGGLVTP